MLTLFTQEQARRMEILSERKEAEEEKAREIAMRMHRHGDTVDVIAEMVGFPVATVKEWLGITVK